MYREFIGGTLILMVILIALYIYQSVRRRRARQEAELPDYESLATEQILFSCLYVATVYAERPLERVWAYGLGGRGRARVGLSGLHLVIERTGERSIAIPRTHIQEVRRGGATIDRGVEKSGLVQILWSLGDYSLLTSLRITSNQEQSYLKLREVIGV